MDELTIDGKTYLSSKKAAAVTGYAKDYVGQLCREGRVEAKLVGRSWYVYEPSIREHRFNDDRKKGKEIEEAQEAEPVTVFGSPVMKEEVSEKPNVEAVWERPSYTPEPLEILPELPEMKHEATITEPEPNQEPSSESLSEMQSAWQEWFTVHAKTVPVPEEEPIHELKEAPYEEVRHAVREVPTHFDLERPVEPENVPLRVVVGDIAPRKYTPVEPVVRKIEQERQHEGRQQVRRNYQERKQRTGSPLVAKSIAIAFIVICGALTLVATGLIDELHIGGISDSPVIRFFQGSNVIEKI